MVQRRKALCLRHESCSIAKETGGGSWVTSSVAAPTLPTFCSTRQETGRGHEGKKGQCIGSPSNASHMDGKEAEG